MTELDAYEDEIVRLNDVVMTDQYGNPRVTLEECEKEFREYRTRIVRESEFASEREEARLADWFAVFRGLQTMFERDRHAFQLTYDALPEGLTDFLWVVPTITDEAQMAP